MNEISEVFKVVQMDEDGRMFSVNSNNVLDKNNPKDVTSIKDDVVEYHVNRVTYPLRHLKKIFVTDTYDEALRAARFYQRNGNKKTVILKGIGPNKQVLSFRQEVPYKRNKQEHFLRVPDDFKTTLVDWFIPTDAVLKLKKT